MKAYTLEGLDCAHCASMIEMTVKGGEGVSFASLNFITKTLRVTKDDSDADELLKWVTEIVHIFEPDVKVLEKTANVKANNASASDAEEKRRQIAFTLMTVSILVFFAGLFHEHVQEGNADVFFLLSYIGLGYSVLLRTLKNISRGNFFDENTLMSIATIGALFLGEYAEAAAVMLFYKVGLYYQQKAVNSSRRSIAELMDIRAEFATVRHGDQLIQVAPEDVEIGDTIIVKPGEKVPLDGIVTSGESYLDTAALTGESLPRRVEVGSVALSGCVNQSGLISIEVNKAFGESTVAKILDLVENAADKKAQTEDFITSFAKVYTPAVVVLAILLAAIPTLFFDGIFGEWLRRALIFLVISCPCALVLSIPLSFFAGIGAASRKGILVKGSNYLEALNSIDTVVFDKTGTLTRGVFKVTELRPYGGHSAEMLLATAAHAESYSNHPIGLSIMKEYAKEVDRAGVSDYSELAGFGIRAVWQDKEVLAGSYMLMQKNGINCSEFIGRGSKVYVAMAGEYLGCIIVSDELKVDSKRAIAALGQNGVSKSIMLTGDNEQAAAEIAAELDLSDYYAELLPQDKVAKVEQLKAKLQTANPKGRLAFVGDGINDAPVLAMADIGVAMGAFGSDAAIEAADIVLMTDEPMKLVEAVQVARFTRIIVMQNIVFVLAVKLVFLGLGAMGLASMWEAVFADVGVALLSVLNAMRVLRG